MNKKQDEHTDQRHDSFRSMPHTIECTTKTTDIDISTASQMNGLYEWWLRAYSDCPINLTESNAFNDEKSIATQQSNEQATTQFCRPNAEQILHNLKQSLFWSNLTKMDGRSHEMLLHITQSLLDTTFIERSTRVCTYSNLTQKLQSNEILVSSSKTKTENRTTNASISDKTLEHLTEYSKDCKAMSKGPCENVTEHQHVDVLILGGGLAGLGAATILSKSFYKGKRCTYLLLEAQDRAGGRIQTCKLRKCSHLQNGQITKHCKTNVKNNSHQIDAGAQWLHGRHNQLYAMSERNRLLAAEQSEEGLGSFLYEHGKQIDPYLVKKVDFYIGQVLSECEQFARYSVMSVAPKSVGHFLRERFQEFVDQMENIDDKKYARDLFEWHVRFQIIDNSCLTLDQLSAKYWGKYSFNGESCQAHYNFKNGFSSIVDCLIDGLNSDSIGYNKQVIAVKIHDNRAAPNNNDDRKMANVSVSCSDGSVYTANHVLVTFSLGVLKKQHKLLFHPNLPEFMQSAIECIGFETINKIFLEFDTQWWTDLDGIQFIFDHNEEKSEWTHYLTGFDVLKPHHPNILLGWIGGRGAIQMETLTDKQIIQDCVDLLAKFTNKTVPYPTRYYCTRWHSNPYINGAYSHISTNCDHNETIAHNLLSKALTFDDFYGTSVAEANQVNGQRFNQSKSMPIVLFAGEACHDAYFSTAHGAYLSGVEQAKKFLVEQANKLNEKL